MDRYKDCTFAQTNLVRAEVTIPLAWVCSCNHRLPELSQKTLLRAVPIGVWKGILEGPAEAGP